MEDTYDPAHIWINGPDCLGLVQKSCWFGLGALSDQTTVKCFHAYSWTLAQIGAL